jgi:hypothetical protein
VAVLDSKASMEEPDEYSQDSSVDGVMAMIAPHATGHQWTKDGSVLRVDCERGIGWVATQYDLNLRVIQQVTGSDEDVHRVAAWWAKVHRDPREKEHPVRRRAGFVEVRVSRAERAVNVGL